MKNTANYFGKTIFTTLFAIVLLATSSSAATFTVTNTNDSGAGSLRQAVLDADATAIADNIVFDASFNTPRTITLLTTIQISTNTFLNDTLTITGAGANLLTINGNNATQLFRVFFGDTISFSGMTMTGGNGIRLGSVTNGGAIVSDGTLTLTNMVFTGNTSPISGGAVSNGGSGVLNVVGCTFTNNTTTGTGINGTGGSAIHSRSGVVTINNSTFTGGTTLGGGGGLRFEDGVNSITNSTISNNTSGSAGNASGGGGIFSNSELTLTNSTVSNNTANGDTLGGGIRNVFRLTLNNSIVTGNTATRGGGGIHAEGPGSAGEFTNITNSTISNNIGNTGSTSGITEGNGGGIYVGSVMTATITDSTISGNFIRFAATPNPLLQGNGGGIFSDGAVTLTNSTVSGNIADTSGGGIYDGHPGGVTDIVTLISSTIVNNRASNAGGVENRNTAGNGAVNIRNTIIANNIATASPDVRNFFTSQGYNLIRNTTGASVGGGVGNIFGVDPNLGPLSFNGGATRTHALIFGSPAIDTGDPTTFPATDQRGITRPQDGDGTGGARSDIGAYERRLTDVLAHQFADFDGDGKTDLSIFRPAPGEWWYNKSSNDGNFATQFGASTDKLVPGDYTGDGKSDFAFFRPSTGQWFILRSEDFSFFAFPFGNSTDTPVPADYDGDGKTDAAVFRSSSLTWFINKSTGGTDIIGFGSAGDKPVIGDYDGDGKADIAIYRNNGGISEWWIRRSSNATVFALQFGISTDKAVQGDYTGDGKTDVAIFRPSNGNWFILRSEDFSFFSFPFGTSTDVPSPGDYDGDGRFDAAVFRPSNSTWFVQRSTAGTLIQGFGITGDLPIPNAFVP